MRHERQIFQETLRFRAPDGFGDAIARAAACDLTTSSEFVRRVLVERLRALGIDPVRGNDDSGDRTVCRSSK